MNPYLFRDFFARWIAGMETRDERDHIRAAILEAINQQAIDLDIYVDLLSLLEFKAKERGL